MAPAKVTSISRPHAARARVSSHTEMPSVSQRGTRWFESWMVITCASSCHNVAPQLNSPGGRALGESSVTTLPKQAPSAPIIPGRPTLRTAKSSWRGNISIRIGPVGVKFQRFDRVASASRASAGTYSPITPASSGCRRITMSPSRIVTKPSRVSSRPSRL